MSKQQLTPIGQICQGIDKMKSGLSEALPAGIDPEKFVKNAKNALQMHAQQEALSKCDRKTIFTALTKAASDGLNIDGQESFLSVHYMKKDGKYVASYQPMVQGLVKLARNSGLIESIDSEVVYSNDKFKLIYGYERDFSHEPNYMVEDRGEPIMVWAMVTLSSGERIVRS